MGRFLQFLNEGATRISGVYVYSGPSINQKTFKENLKGNARFLFTKTRWYMWDGLDGPLHEEIYHGLTGRMLSIFKDSDQQIYASAYPIVVEEFAPREYTVKPGGGGLTKPQIEACLDKWKREVSGHIFDIHDRAHYRSFA